MPGELYFTKFEDRVPERPQPNSAVRTYLFQILAIVFVGFGLAYLWWRWNYSLNPDAYLFSVSLVTAETLSFFGSLLLVFNMWSNKDPKPSPPVRTLSDIRPLGPQEADRPLSIDVFIATYNEDLELVRYTVRDAKAMTYPYPDVPVSIYVLDDGRRDGRDPAKENFRQMAADEGVGYFCRETNEGYKAGNLNHAFPQTHGDLLVILDADTRPFPQFLEKTTGHFRNPKLAWVQTPQWFYDLTGPVRLNEYLGWYLGSVGRFFGKGMELLVGGKWHVGRDIFGNDPKMFYDIILRRRNNYNASFCCGAGSVHRREALEDLARKEFRHTVDDKLRNEVKARDIHDANRVETLRQEIERSTDMRPFVHHASEDIYTSMLLHADKEKCWESVLHPEVECKMLSPQDLDSFVKQRTRYATGSLDIAFSRHNPLFLKGLSPAQKVSYWTTIYSYFAPFWLIVFLLSPAIFFFTLQTPLMAFNFDFFKYFIPFQLLNVTVVTIATWGIPTKRAEQYYVASFWFFLQSLWKVLRRRVVQFNVTPKKAANTHGARHALPHIAIVGLTLIGILYNLYLIYMEIHPSYSAFFANCVWGSYNAFQLSAFVRAAYWKNKPTGS